MTELTTLTWTRADGGVTISHVQRPPDPVMRNVPVLVTPEVVELTTDPDGNPVSIVTAPAVWGVEQVADYQDELQRIFHEDGEAAYLEALKPRLLQRGLLAGAKLAGRDLPAPADRTFRDAWRAGDRGVDVDMPEARKIHMGRIRSARDRVLAVKDIEYQVANERGQGADKTRIAAEKETLRNLPATFDLDGATTPDELKALWPAELA